MAGWNIADVLEVVAAEVPDAPAVTQGQRLLTWRDLDGRADRLLAFLQERGHGPRDHVAQYLRNCPEYLESLVATIKGAMVPVNTNYRYGPDELAYLWHNADVTAVVFHASYSQTIHAIRAQVPQVRTWLWLADDSAGSCPQWAVDYDQVVSSHDGAFKRPDRSGDDMILLYTGGTTGLPKGVMWRQDDLFMLLANATSGRYGGEQDLALARSRIARPGRVHLPAAPLMHGAGCFTCIPFLSRGGSVALLEATTFDPIELLDVVQHRRVNSVGWVGDVFARPVLDALRASPSRWDLSSWRTITSGGMAFTEETKRGLRELHPGLVIADVYGSSEVLSAAHSISSAGHEVEPNATFRASATTAVLRADNTFVAPGSGEPGLLAFAARQPLGYYKDEAKTAETFRTIDGRRWTVPGDMATVAEDGTITLLGRGSTCINSGGEKVYPEEVEVAIRSHPLVVDAIVIGLPDERFGERVAAAVQPEPGEQLDDDELRAHLAARVARYKVPRTIRFVDRVPRGPNGKPDFGATRHLLTDTDTR